ncbi:MAG: alpha/beta hydrolase [Moraxella sp.]|nr:alpha/beta hydrolase [Moraxella sp.]
MKIRALSLLLMSLSLAGCLSLATPKQIQSHIITSGRTSIATSRQLSNQARAILLTSGHQDAQSCFLAFDECIQSIQDGFFDTPINKPRLAFLAELYYAHALYHANRPECHAQERPPINPYYANAQKTDDEISQTNQTRQACFDEYRHALYQAVNHSYGYLFFDELTGNHGTKNIVHENDIKAQDIYHLATNTLIGEIYKQQNGVFAHARQDKNHPYMTNVYGQLHANSYLTDTHKVHFYIDNDFEFLNAIQNHAHAFDDLISAYDVRMANLDTQSVRSGLGVSYVGVLTDRRTPTISVVSSQDSKERIHPTGHLILTAIAKPQGNDLQQVLNSQSIDIHFFNPHRQKTVEIFGKPYPLSANFSASYGMWLGENRLNQLAILNMLQKKSVALPELFMLEPYNPNKKVVIMVHGLASSPATWVNFTNNLLADPILQNNYQVWQIFYATNLPILENRHQIQELIKTAYQMTDPQGTHPASQNSVLIGHSMGGVISRMMVSDDDLSANMDELAYLVSDDTAPKKPLNDQEKQALRQRFTLHALPQVDTAVFISTPFQGTDYAERWFTQLARKVIRLPLDLTENAIHILTKNISESDLTTPISERQLKELYLQNGASQLSDRSAFMALTANIQINDNVRYHTIIGDSQGLYEKNPDQLVQFANQMTDGIVPYHSSHLDGAMSETIITGKHNIHENPKTIRQLRKILHDHLKRTKTQ